MDKILHEHDLDQLQTEYDDNKKIYTIKGFKLPIDDGIRSQNQIKNIELFELIM